MIRNAKKIKRPIKILSTIAAAVLSSVALLSSSALAFQFDWNYRQKITQDHPNIKTKTEEEFSPSVQNVDRTNDATAEQIPVSPVSTPKPTYKPKTPSQDFIVFETGNQPPEKTISSKASSPAQMPLAPSPPSSTQDPQVSSSTPSSVETAQPVSTASSSGGTRATFIGETRSNIHRIWGSPDSVTPDHTKEIYHLEDGSTAVFKYRNDVLYEGYLLKE